MLPSLPLPRLKPRPENSHKGDYGRALLIGGSRGMSGAIALAGMGALRSGAGLVTLAVPKVCLETVAMLEPCYMTSPLPCDAAGGITLAACDHIKQIAGTSTCIGCGPGLGRAKALVDVVRWMYESLPQPMVLDADALYALAQSPGVMSTHAGPRVLTPHPGEMRRLIGDETCQIDQLREQAIKMAGANQIVIVLKGQRSLITDGSIAVQNETGNAGMATGGSGDVLTGVITALICQELDPLQAAQLGAHVHGLAGDLSAERLGQISLIASDLVRQLPFAFQRLEVKP